MKLKTVVEWACVSGLAMMVCLAQGGPLEDAKQLAASGRHGEVDAALEPLLEKVPVSTEALLVSFDSAVADGRLFTAERRALSILDSGQKPTADFVFKAAEVAGLLGKTSIKRDRMAYYAKLEPGATPQVRRALVALCLEGAEAENLIRYAQQFGADGDSLTLGIRHLASLRRDAKADEYLKLLDFMLGKWTAQPHYKRIVAEMMAARRANVPGLSREAMSDVLVKHKVGDLDLLYQWGWTENGWGGPAGGSDYVLKVQKAMAPAMLPQNLLAGALGMNAYVEADRAAYAKRIAELQTVFQQASDPGYARMLLNVVARHPLYFLEGDAPAVSPAKAMELVRHVARTSPRDLDLLTDIRYVWTKTKWSDADKQAFANEFPLFVHHDTVYEMYGADLTAKMNVAGMRQVIAKFGATPELKTVFFDSMIRIGDAGLVKDTFRDYLLENPHGFNPDRLAQFLGFAGVALPDRVALLQDCFRKTGWSGSWKRVAENKNLPHNDNPAVLAFLATLKPEARGSDPFLAGLCQIAALGRLPGNKAPDGVHDVAKRAMAGFPGTYPNPANPVMNNAFSAFFNHYWELVRHDREACALWVAVMLPKLGKDAPWDRAGEIAWNASDPAAFYQYAKARIAIEGGYSPKLAGYTEAKGAKEALLSPYYAQMGDQAAADYVLRSLPNWEPAVALRELANVLNVIDPDKISNDFENRLMGAVWAECSKPDAITNTPALPFERLMAVYFDAFKGAGGPRYTLMTSLRAVGKLDVAAQRYLAGAAKLPPMEKHAAIGSLLQWGDGRGDAPVLARAVGDEDLSSPLGYFNIAANAYLASMKALPGVEAAKIPDRGMRHLDALKSRFPKEIEAGKFAPVFTNINEQVMAALSNGGECFENPGAIHGLAIGTARGALERGDVKTFARLCRAVVLCYDDARGWDINGLIKAAVDAKQWESAYILAGVSSSRHADLNAALARWRSEVSSHMPGVYPVNESDPAYPLYVAADELLQNRNPERAWTLLRANLAVFEKDPLRYSPQFVAWAVEQLRHSRGDKDALLLKSKALVDAMLAKEKQLSADLAASLMLTRAEIARDQRRFDAAHLEYQAIRNHPVYQSTEAGRQAMFRDVDLMVSMGNLTGAQETVDQWLSIPEPSVQAQAHYMLARMAFERGDHEETRKQIEMVFGIDFTHTEARLLHGRWKLATNNEVDETQVLVGTLADRTLIRPGQPLALTVQDRNLGVAGGGASIPILVTTSGGRDVEVISLYPSARDPFLFRGALDTALSAAVPSNLVLNVRGDEEVVYQVHPSFLSARGLKSAGTKVLRVVDDASMAASAAVPDAGEGRAEDELVQELTGTLKSGEDRMLTRNLRPGSPLYVAVKDFDRSVSPARDSISVSVSTTSGDKLSQVALEETAEYAGIFRAAVPTRLPPPLVQASDSAAGVNPCDIINSRRAGVWRSLPDGKKGKWVEIDTMGSHLVAEALLNLPRPKAITHLKLFGRLSEGEQLVGSYPVDPAGSRGGIGVQGAGGRLRDSNNIRRHLLKQGAETKPLADWRGEYAGEASDLCLLVSGAFCPPESRRLKLRLETILGEGENLDENALRDLRAKAARENRLMRDLWVQVLLDGDAIFEGSGTQLAQMTEEVDFEARPHVLEIFAQGRSRYDAFKLVLEQDDRSFGPMDPVWTDPAQNETLAAFLKDRAAIAQTDTGFAATFKTPLRLRSLRWVFTDFTGDEVVVDSAVVVDADGKQVIPVETDYSDTLDNDTLEVAPGDRIQVTYVDEFTSGGDKRILERSLASSFHDADVDFFFEAFQMTENGPVQELHEAYRILPGDSVLLKIVDPDMDATPGVDAVTVKLSCGTRPAIEVRAQELVKQGVGVDGADEVVGGEFVAVVKTVDATDAAAVAASPKALQVAASETVRAFYHDRENTMPGIPVEREKRLPVSGRTEPRLQLYHTWRNWVEDKGERARAQLRQIQRRPGNENVKGILAPVFHGKPMSAEEMASTEPVPVNSAVPIPLIVDDPSRARHAGSKIAMEALAQSEIAAAAAEGREPEPVVVELGLGGLPGDIRFADAAAKAPLSIANTRFSGLLKLRLGSAPPEDKTLKAVLPQPGDPVEIQVAGNDSVRLRLLDDKGAAQSERWLKLVSAARLELMDSTYAATRDAVHLGDRFNVLLEDPDCDVSSTQDVVQVGAFALQGGAKRLVDLKETMPHSGVFTGGVRPVFFGTNAIPADLGDQIPVAYGDTLAFRYSDAVTTPLLEPGIIDVRGTVHQGADGRVRMFSKRFRDAEQAVQVQFSLAECLFEKAKELRKLGQKDKSAEAIAEGRSILEGALRDYPGTQHAVQGEYLLGNLYQELAAEHKEAKEMNEARPLYQEALARFTGILSTWPESDYAARAQYHKALCLEMLEDYARASEEYVKMTYMYPESPLVGDATIRLATYYYTQERKYDTAGRIYANFQKRFPTHERAAGALFMGAQCRIKQAETLWGEKLGKGGVPPLVADEYQAAIEAFTTLIDTYGGSSEQEQKLRAQAMYWAGDSSFKVGDFKNAYLFFKRTVFEYPETEWARRARGMLLQESKAFEALEE